MSKKIAFITPRQTMNEPKDQLSPSGPSRCSSLFRCGCGREFESEDDYGAHMALQTCWKATDTRKKREGLADQVKDLERRATEWEKLAREVMATIRFNRLRGTITSADEKHFDQICEGLPSLTSQLVRCHAYRPCIRFQPYFSLPIRSSDRGV